MRWPWDEAYKARRLESFRHRFLTGFPGKVFRAAQGDTNELQRHLLEDDLTSSEDNRTWLAWLIGRQKRYPRGRADGYLAYGNKGRCDDELRAKQYVALHVRLAKAECRTHSDRQRIHSALNDALYRRAVELVKQNRRTKSVCAGHGFR